MVKTYFRAEYRKKQWKELREYFYCISKEIANKILHIILKKYCKINVKKLLINENNFISRNLFSMKLKNFPNIINNFTL